MLPIVTRPIGASETISEELLTLNNANTTLSSKLHEMMRISAGLKDPQIQSIYVLAKEIKEKSLQERAKVVCISKKSNGSGSERSDIHRIVEGVDHLKLHFFSYPTDGVVSIHFSRRKDKTGHYPRSISGTYKIFTPCMRLDIDLGDNDRSVIHSLGRLRGIPNGIASDIYAAQLERLKREMSLLLKARGYTAISQLYEGLLYTGSHRGKPINKISMFQKYYRDGDLYYFHKNWLKASPAKEEQRKILIPLFKSLAKGLAELESLEIIHNDIKLENIFLDGALAIISDFDAAVLRKDILEGVSYGYTPSSLAPERVRALFSGLVQSDSISHASDMFAMGCVFYRLLVCDLPHWLDVQDSLEELCLLKTEIDQLIEVAVKAKENLPDLVNESSIEEADVNSSDDSFDDSFVEDFELGPSKLVDQLKETIAFAQGQITMQKNEKNFEMMMPIPAFQADLAQVPVEPNKFNIAEILEFYIGMFNDLFDFDCSKLSDESNSRVLGDIIENARLLKDKNEVICQILKQHLERGWAEWKKLPLSVDPLIALVQKMLTIDPKERITPKELIAELEHLSC